MNTIELINALKSNKITAKKFNGVFPSDCLPKKKLKKPAFVIANTQDRHGAGEHWVGFYFPKCETKKLKNQKTEKKKKSLETGEFFDYFGQKPVNKTFIKFLKTNCDSFSYNKKQLQGNFSITCGQWCCVYMHYKCAGFTLKKFLKLFSKKKLDVNDKKIIHLYHKFFNNNNSNNNGGGGISRGGAYNLIQQGGKKKKQYIQCCLPRFK